MVQLMQLLTTNLQDIGCIFGAHNRLHDGCLGIWGSRPARGVSRRHPGHGPGPSDGLLVMTLVRHLRNVTVTAYIVTGDLFTVFAAAEWCPRRPPGTAQENRPMIERLPLV